MTIQELTSLLEQQKRSTAEYITGNLSVYSFFPELSGDLTKIKEEIKAQCMKSKYAPDFEVLKKYIKG